MVEGRSKEGQERSKKDVKKVLLCKISGKLQQRIREGPGKVSGRCEKDTTSERVKEGPRKDLGSFREASRKVQGRFREASGKLPVSFLENPGKQGREGEALDSPCCKHKQLIL